MDMGSTHAQQDCDVPVLDYATVSLREINMKRIWSRLIGVGLVAGFVSWAALSKGTVEMFLDPAGLAIVFGAVLGGLWISFDPRLLFDAFAKSFQSEKVTDPQKVTLYAAVFSRAHQLAWGAGLLGTLIGMVLMLANMADPAAVGPGMAVSLLTLLYGAFLAEFIFGPLKSGMIEQSIAAAAASDAIKDDDGKRTPAYAIAGASACITAFFIILASIGMS
jgi:flagellar motor component MotA